MSGKAKGSWQLAACSVHFAVKDGRTDVRYQISVRTKAKD